MNLRPYQLDCLKAIDKKLQEGISRQMIVLPTGAGKTIIFSELIRRKNLKTLVIAHRLELLEQAKDKLKLVAPDISAGILCGRTKEISKQVTIASIQSATNAIPLLKKQNYQLLIIDEAHHAPAKTYRSLIEALGFIPPKIPKAKKPMIPAKIKPYLKTLGLPYSQAFPSAIKQAYRSLAKELHPDKNKGSQDSADKFKEIQEAYDFLNERPGLLLKESDLSNLQGKDPTKPVLLDPTKLLVGFTATPKRGDKAGLDHIFQKITFKLSIRKLVNRKFLIKPQGLHVKIGIDLHKVKSKMGDFKQGSLRNIMLSSEAREIIVETIKKFANKRHSIVFGVDIEHSELLKQDIQNAGFSCEAVHSKISKEERRNRLKAFEEGNLQFLTNPMILTEGFDCSRADCMINASPTRNRSLYIQRAGRVLRLHPDKEDALLIDFGMTKKKHRLVTAIDLMGKAIRMKTIDDYEEIYPPKEEIEEEEAQVTDLKAENETYDPLWKGNNITPICSQNEWEGPEDVFDSYHWPTEKVKATYKQKELIRDLADRTGIDIASLNDLGIKQASKIITRLIAKDKALRAKEPITERQAWFLKKVVSENKIEGVNEEMIYSLTKGSARTLIGRLKSTG